MITEVNKEETIWERATFSRKPLAGHACCDVTLPFPFPEVLQVTSHQWITERLNVLEWVLQCVKIQRPLLGWVSECRFCCQDRKQPQSQRAKCRIPRWDRSFWESHLLNTSFVGLGMMRTSANILGKTLSWMSYLGRSWKLGKWETKYIFINKIHSFSINQNKERAVRWHNCFHSSASFSCFTGSDLTESVSCSSFEKTWGCVQVSHQDIQTKTEWTYN